MNIEETAKILMLVQASYPSFKVADKNVTLNLWQRMLGEYEYNTVQQAVISIITTSTSDFAPSIGKMIDAIHNLASPQEMPELEAWGMVRRAINNSCYNSQEEFNKLPQNVQKALGSPVQLRMWATDESFNESVVQSNFMRSYRAVCEREKSISKLPKEIRQAIGVAQNMGISTTKESINV